MWSGAEVEIYDRLKKKTEKLQQDMPAYVKKSLKKTYRHDDSNKRLDTYRASPGGSAAR
jgi:tRNA A-37 threonylcarbamoyl transferase component Bud32